MDIQQIQSVIICRIGVIGVPFEAFDTHGVQSLGFDPNRIRMTYAS